MIKERRRSPRLKVCFGVEIAHKKLRIITNTVNISSSGIYCQADRNIPLFREIDIALSLPGMDRQIECTGVIVRSEKAERKNLYNLAIFFTDISSEDKNVLSEHIKKRMGRGV